MAYQFSKISRAEDNDDGEATPSSYGEESTMNNDGGLAHSTSTESISLRCLPNMRKQVLLQVPGKQTHRDITSLQATSIIENHNPMQTSGIDDTDDDELSNVNPNGGWDPFAEPMPPVLRGSVALPPEILRRIAVSLAEAKENRRRRASLTPVSGVKVVEKDVQKREPKTHEHLGIVCSGSSVPIPSKTSNSEPTTRNQTVLNSTTCQRDVSPMPTIPQKQAVEEVTAQKYHPAPDKIRQAVPTVNQQPSIRSHVTSGSWHMNGNCGNPTKAIPPVASSTRFSGATSANEEAGHVLLNTVETHNFSSLINTSTTQSQQHAGICNGSNHHGAVSGLRAWWEKASINISPLAPVGSGSSISTSPGSYVGGNSTNRVVTASPPPAGVSKGGSGLSPIYGGMSSSSFTMSPLASNKSKAVFDGAKLMGKATFQPVGLSGTSPMSLLDGGLEVIKQKQEQLLVGTPPDKRQSTPSLERVPVPAPPLGRLSNTMTSGPPGRLTSNGATSLSSKWKSNCLTKTHATGESCSMILVGSSDVTTTQVECVAASLKVRMSEQPPQRVPPPSRKLVSGQQQQPPRTSTVPQAKCVPHPPTPVVKIHTRSGPAVIVRIVDKNGYTTTDARISHFESLKSKDPPY